MTAQQPIINSIKALLANGTNGVYTAVGGRIYNAMAPQDPTCPFINFTIISDPVQPYFQVDDILVEFQVDIFNKVEAGTAADRAIADNVFATLHRQTLTISGYTGCSILCQDRGLSLDQDLVIGGRTQQDVWRITQSYRLFGTGS